MDVHQEQVQHYELLKIILDFVGVIAWPIITLIIVIVYKEAAFKFLSRARKVELPGGVSFEAVENDIKEAKGLAKEIEEERSPKLQGIINKEVNGQDNKVNQRMIELSLRPSPSGLNLDYYRNIAETNTNLALAGLRLDFEIMLRNLAKGFDIAVSDREPVSRVISTLYEDNAITLRQKEFIDIVFKISNAAIHGAPISKEQVYEVLRIAQVLVDDYVAWLGWGFPI